MVKNDGRVGAKVRSGVMMCGAPESGQIYVLRFEVRTAAGKNLMRLRVVDEIERA